MDVADAIVLPTTPTPAYTRTDAASFDSESGEHPLSVSTLFTAIFNMTGQPALTVPCGFSPEPASGRTPDRSTAKRRERLFRIGRAYEAATDWQLHRPSRPLGPVAPVPSQ